MIHDKLSNFDIYPFGADWKRAFDFINSITADSEEKRYELGNGVFATVMCCSTKLAENAVIESHQKYIDIQWVIEGAEGINIATSDELTILKEYSSCDDVAFYEIPEKFSSSLINYPGYFAALWPDDAHMPLLKVDSIFEVKKGVVKIPIRGA